MLAPLSPVAAVGAAPLPSAATIDSFSGLEIWCEADMAGANLATDVDGVYTWGDTAYEPLLQSTGSKKPALIADRGDGLPTVRFDGIDDVLVAASTISLVPCSIFFVAQLTVASATQMLISHRLTNRIEVYNNTGGGYSEDLAFKAALSQKQYAQFGSAHWGVYRIEMDGTNAGSKRYLNGALQTPTANPSTGDPGTGIDEPFALGARDFNNTFFWAGDVSALIVYSELKSAADAAAIETILSAWS